MRASAHRRAIVRASALAVAAVAGVAVPLVAVPLDAAQAAPESLTFGYAAGGPTPWVVPDGVDEISVVVAGSAGGTGPRPVNQSGAGGFGARIEATIPVVAGETLLLQGSTVGANAGSDKDDWGQGGAGWRGGGSGNTGSLAGAAGSGGGGASAVTLADGTPLVVAGGGGGGYGGAMVAYSGGDGGAGFGDGGWGGVGAGAAGGGAGGANPNGQGTRGGNAGSSSSAGGGGGGGGGVAGGNGGGGGQAGGGGGGGGGGGSSFVADGVALVSQAGNGGGGSVVVTYEVRRATTTLVELSPGAATFGDPVTARVTVTAAAGATSAPSGSAQILVDGVEVAVVPVAGTAIEVPLGVLDVGTHRVDAIFTPATTDLRPSAGWLDVVVGRAQSTVAVAAPPMARPGDVVALTATVAPVAPATTTPTGVVAFHALVDGVLADAPLAVVDVASDGTATASIAGLAEGTTDIVATFGGDARFLASTSEPAPVRVERAATWTVVRLAASEAPDGDLVVATVTVGSEIPVTGDVELLVDGEVVETLSPTGAPSGDAAAASVGVEQTYGGVLELGAGGHVVTARYLGSDTTVASTSAPATLMVRQVVPPVVAPPVVAPPVVAPPVVAPPVVVPPVQTPSIVVTSDGVSVQAAGGSGGSGVVRGGVVRGAPGASSGSLPQTGAGQDAVGPLAALALLAVGAGLILARRARTIR